MIIVLPISYYYTLHKPETTKLYYIRIVAVLAVAVVVTQTRVRCRRKLLFDRIRLNDRFSIVKTADHSYGCRRLKTHTTEWSSCRIDHNI